MILDDFGAEPAQTELTVRQIPRPERQLLSRDATSAVGHSAALLQAFEALLVAIKSAPKRIAVAHKSPAGREMLPDKAFQARKCLVTMSKSYFRILLAVKMAEKGSESEEIRLANTTGTRCWPPTLDL